MHANAHMKIHLEINFVLTGNKEIYYIFKTCCIITVLFFHKMSYTSYLFLSAQIIHTFCINHALKFKYPPQQDEDMGNRDKAPGKENLEEDGGLWSPSHFSHFHLEEKPKIAIRQKVL